jgi:hypothetical protein
MIGRVLFLTFILVVLVQNGTAQAIPKIKFVVAAEDSVWKRRGQAFVMVTLENLGDSRIEVPSRIDFHIENGSGNQGSYYAPFSLLKSYSEVANGCQNNLSNSDVKRHGGVVGIFPDKRVFVLEGKGKKVLRVDLSGICWALSISSVYPDENVFKIARTGRYTLHFEMEFTSGKMNVQGINLPLVKHVKSNEVEIEIK